MSEKNINSALVRRVNKLLESRVEHDKVQFIMNKSMYKYYFVINQRLSSFFNIKDIIIHFRTRWKL